MKAWAEVKKMGLEKIDKIEKHGAPTAQTPASEKAEKHLVPGGLWSLYDVTWTFLTPVCGSVPADPNLVEKWLGARAPAVKPPKGRSITEIAEEVIASIPETQEASMLQFQRHEGTLCVRAATLRAHLKECARIISSQYAVKVSGERSFAHRFVNAVYHDERSYWLPLASKVGPITKATGWRDKPVHAMTPQGPINALKRLEYVDPPVTLSFRLKVLGRSINLDDIKTVMEYGGCHGYGGERGDGYGRYEYQIREVK